LLTDTQTENGMSTENEARKDLRSKYLHFCTPSKMAAFLLFHLLKKTHVCRKTDWRMAEIEQWKLYDKGARYDERKKVRKKDITNERKKERKKARKKERKK